MRIAREQPACGRPRALGRARGGDLGRMDTIAVAARALPTRARVLGSGCLRSCGVDARVPTPISLGAAMIALGVGGMHLQRVRA
jgi:hypothetical protein